MGCKRACKWVPPKFLHLAQSAIALTMDWSRHGVCILSRRAILMRSRWKCPPFSCSARASSTASSFVMHSCRATAQVRVPPPTNHSFLPSIMYRAAQCRALFLSQSEFTLNTLQRIDHVLEQRCGGKMITETLCSWGCGDTVDTIHQTRCCFPV